jgi:O-antigen ligase/polysaccharide polymerase Wzy-like membrane protein
VSTSSFSVSLDVAPAEKAIQRVDRAAALVFAGLFALTALTLVGSTFLNLPIAIVLVLPSVLFCGWVLYKPAVGFYVLFAAALLIAVQPLTFATSVTDIPFFVNLPVGITPAEILMVVTAVGLIARAVATHSAPPAGRLFWPYLAFGGAIVIGELNGLVHGGDFKLSLWELRPQAYGLVLFVMATVILRERSQLKILAGILLAAEALKGADGVIRYYFLLDPQVAMRLESNQAHEDSYLLGLFAVAVVMGLIWFRRPVVALLVLITPIVLTAILVNHRRAGQLGLGVEIGVVMALAYIVEPRLRRALILVAVPAALILAAFLAINWNHSTGTIGELVRPIKSLFDPNARDFSSDQYRLAETHNLKETFRSSPLLGIGFGHPYYIFYPQNGVSKYDPLWNIIPHNTILWIPMRMGLIGMVTFWGLISMALAEGVWALRIVRDKFVRSAVVFCVAALIGGLFSGYVDVGLESYRNMILIGVLLAVINRARDISGEADTAQPATAASR